MTTPDPAAIRALLNSDPVWAAYALADLQPAFEPYCEWRLAADGRGLALVFTGLSIPTFYAFGPAASVAQAMDDIDLCKKFCSSPDTLILMCYLITY
jgi:hypothetical protein